MNAAASESLKIVASLVAFFVMAYACVHVSKPEQFEPKPLPKLHTAKLRSDKQAAQAILYLFARD